MDFENILTEQNVIPFPTKFETKENYFDSKISSISEYNSSVYETKFDPSRLTDNFIFI